MTGDRGYRGYGRFVSVGVSWAFGAGAMGLAGERGWTVGRRSANLPRSSSGIGVTHFIRVDEWRPLKVKFKLPTPRTKPYSVAGPGRT